jgi:hypothetical protein
MMSELRFKLDNPHIQVTTTTTTTTTSNSSSGVGNKEEEGEGKNVPLFIKTEQETIPVK